MSAADPPLQTRTQTQIPRQTLSRTSSGFNLLSASFGRDSTTSTTATTSPTTAAGSGSGSAGTALASAGTRTLGGEEPSLSSSLNSPIVLPKLSSIATNPNTNNNTSSSSFLSAPTTTTTAAIEENETPSVVVPGYGESHGTSTSTSSGSGRGTGKGDSTDTRIDDDSGGDEGIDRYRGIRTDTYAGANAGTASAHGQGNVNDDPNLQVESTANGIGRIRLTDSDQPAPGPAPVVAPILSNISQLPPPPATTTTSTTPAPSLPSTTPVYENKGFKVLSRPKTLVVKVPSSPANPQTVPQSQAQATQTPAHALAQARGGGSRSKSYQGYPDYLGSSATTTTTARTMDMDASTVPAPQRASNQGLRDGDRDGSQLGLRLDTQSQNRSHLLPSPQLLSSALSTSAAASLSPASAISSSTLPAPVHPHSYAPSGSSSGVPTPGRKSSTSSSTSTSTSSSSRYHLDVSSRTILPRRLSLLAHQIMPAPATGSASTNTHSFENASGSASSTDRSPEPAPVADVRRSIVRRGSLRERVKAHLQLGSSRDRESSSSSSSMSMPPPGSAGSGSQPARRRASGTSSPALSTAGSGHGHGNFRGEIGKGKSRDVVVGEVGPGVMNVEEDSSSLIPALAGRADLQPGASSIDDGWKSPMSATSTVEDDVIETGEINLTRHHTGRKMINQYIILQEIGRGQHGQVRLGKEEITSREMSRNGSIASGIDDPSKISSELQNASGAVTPTSAPTQYWAIKIVDRQAKKKLPGFKKMSSGLGKNESMGPTIANDKLRREIAILKKCRHPNVVRLREVIDSPQSKKIYLILEYCEKGEVKWQSPSREPLLTVAESRKIFRDIVCGLEYLHHQGIIHRDIKPANLLYSSDGTVKISDFGVSHYSHVLRSAKEDDVNSTGSPEDEELEPAFTDEHDLAKTAGSPAFFAPELCYNGADIPTPAHTPTPTPPLIPSPIEHTASDSPDFRWKVDDAVNNRLSVASSGSGTARPDSPGSMLFQKNRPPITEAIDIWALGVTLYCFLFGRVPFDSSSEYALFTIIPTRDYEVPATMGADKIPTGGRFAYKNGRENGLSTEACEALDLLNLLLEKDPVKRIKLEAVKRHPFVLRGISDQSAWLAKTDPGMGTYVTVTNDEVKAAVTNSSSFRAKVKKGLQTTISTLSTKFWKQQGGRDGSRSRSGSVLDIADSTATTPSGSQLPTPGSRKPSFRIDPSPSTPRGPPPLEEHTSPRIAMGLSRKLSALSTELTRRSRSPLPQTIQLSSPPASNLTLPDGDDTGRSISDRSSFSSINHPGRPTGRAMASRRLSSHLPTVVDKPLSPPKSLSASNSTDELDDLIKSHLVSDGPKVDHHKLTEERVRARASSNASLSGLRGGFGLRNIISRGFSQRSNSSNRQLRSEPSETDEADISNHEMRESKSVETFASSMNSNDQVILSSPEVTQPTLLPPLSVQPWDARAAIGLSERSDSQEVVEEADWDGSISDDDEADYGQPLRFDRIPGEGDTLSSGNWKLDGSGWRGEGENENRRPAALGLSIQPPPSALASPAEINTEPDADATPLADGPTSADTYNFPSPLGTSPPKTTPTSMVPTSPTTTVYPMHPEIRRRSVSRTHAHGSPLRLDRAKSPLSRTSHDKLSVNPRCFDTFHDDEEEDEEEEEDDGLEFDFGKRGRRSSKPLTPAQVVSRSLPSR